MIITIDPSFVGYLYFDLHPRAGKYGHAANFGLTPGYTDIKTGKRNFPVTSLVCNFTRDTKQKPALLKHSEVVTFFHELGHGIHGLMGKTEYSRFDGTSVSRDFVEMPSQFLEYFCWDQGQLKNLSNHYQTNEPMPDDLIDPEIDSITDIVSSYLDNEEISALEPLISDRFDIIKTPEKLKEARTPISKKSLIKEFTTPKLEQIPRFKQQFESVSLPDSLHSDITPDKSVVFMDFESHTNSDRLFIKSSSSLNISFRSISKRLSLTDMAKASSTHNLTINSGSRDSTFITPPLETIRRDSFAYQRYRSHLEKDKNSEKDRKYSYL